MHKYNFFLKYMLTKFSNKNTRGLVVSKEEKEKKMICCYDCLDNILHLRIKAILQCIR